jgi:hypothetical protein
MDLDFLDGRARLEAAENVVGVVLGSLGDNGYGLVPHESIIGHYLDVKMHHFSTSQPSWLDVLGVCTLWASTVLSQPSSLDVSRERGVLLFHFPTFRYKMI